jgi:hypothetical protein
MYLNPNRFLSILAATAAVLAVGPSPAMAGGLRAARRTAA